MQEVFEKIIEKLEEMEDLNYNVWQEYEDYINYGVMDGFKQAIEIVNQATEEYNNGWIPVSERLPNFEERKKAYCRNEHGAEFVVMIEGATLPTTLYIKMQEDIWFDEQGELYNVVAWQPLPEPYQPKGDKE